MTLYVESNFVLEIALGQEELAFAEGLLAAAEAGTVSLALPSICLSEPLSRVTRGIRDRRRLMSQLNQQVGQLARSTPHQTEVGALQAVPDLFANIDQREMDRLIGTLDRLLATARLIELDRSSFQNALDFRTRYGLETEDAFILAVVASDLRSKPSTGRHIFATRNRKDFNDPGIATDLNHFGCDLAWSFEETVRMLGIR